MNEEFYIWMEEVYGLETILEQNDLEPWQAIKLLVESGLIDIGDYFCSSLELEDED